MTRAPNLQVPQASPPRAKSGLSGFAFVLFLILLVVNIFSIFVSPGRRAPGFVAEPRSSLTADQLKRAAIELENKNVGGEAAGLWREYLAEAELAPVEVGNIRYRIAKNLQNAGRWEEAFAEFVRAEMLLGESNPDLTHEIARRRMECLRRLGQFADLSREIAARASAAPEEGDLASRQVVAEIEGEKITVADFDRLLSSEIDLAVKSRLGQSPEEENAMRKRALEQFADPQVRAQQLQHLVAARVLAREARKQDLQESPAFREQLIPLADGLLSTTLLHQEIGKRATVTDADVRRYYEANKDRYAEPPATFIAHVLCRDEEAARAVIARVQGGESFDKIAEAESLDAATRKTMGIVSEPVPADGDYVPTLGANAAAHNAIRDGEAGKVLPDPYASSRGWHVIKVLSHREKVERAFEDVAGEVRRDTIAARQQETTAQYIKELFDDYGVSLYPEVFLKQASPAPAKAEAEKKP